MGAEVSLTRHQIYEKENKSQQKEEEGIHMSDSKKNQEEWLKHLKDNSVPISIYLINGIRLQGYIADWDQFSINLQGDTNLMVYKKSIATIVTE